MAEGENNKEAVDKEKNKELDKLIKFLDRFIVCGENTKNGTIEVDAEGHVAWKEIKGSQINEKSNANAGNEEGNEDEDKEYDNFDFYSIQLEFKRKDVNGLAKVIRSRLKKLIKFDEVSFNVNQRLTQDAYGYADKSNYPILIKYIESLKRSSTSHYRKDLVKKNKNGKMIVKPGTSISIRLEFNENGKREEATFINLINIRNALSKTRGKVIVDINETFKAQKLSDNIFILEPDIFFCAIFGDDLFIFNLPYFFYMFVPTPILMKHIESRKKEMEKTVVNSEYLIKYAKKMPAHVRDLYFFIENASKIPEKETIEKDINIMKNAGVEGDIFELSEDNKITCTEKNAGLILSYISKKLGLRISDKRLVNVEASTNV